MAFAVVNPQLQVVLDANRANALGPPDVSQLAAQGIAGIGKAFEGAFEKSRQRKTLADVQKLYEAQAQAGGQVSPLAPLQNIYGGQASPNTTAAATLNTAGERPSFVPGGGEPPETTALLRKFEGYRDKPYWDVNAYRVGYGSDTITDPTTGAVRQVRPGDRISREMAEADLARRVPEFQQTIERQTPVFATLPENVKAGLTSVAYNYGSLPKSVVAAVNTGDPLKIAGAVRGLAGHNKGVNADRRSYEASVIASAPAAGPPPPVAQAPAAPIAATLAESGIAPLGQAAPGVAPGAADLPAPEAQQAAFYVPQGPSPSEPPNPALVPPMPGVMGGAPSLAGAPAPVMGPAPAPQQIAQQQQPMPAPMPAPPMRPAPSGLPAAMAGGRRAGPDPYALLAAAAGDPEVFRTVSAQVAQRGQGDNDFGVINGRDGNLYRYNKATGQVDPIDSGPAAPEYDIREVGGRIVATNKADPRQSFDATPQNLSAAGYRPMTADERASYRVPENTGAYMDASGKPVVLPGTASTTTKITNTPENKGNVKAAEEKAKRIEGRYESIVTQGDAANASKPQIEQLAEILNRVGPQGKLADIKTAIGPWAQAAGITVEGLDDAQTVQAVIENVAPKQRVVGSGAQSDKEYEGFKRSLATLLSEPKTRQSVLGFLQSQNETAIARASIIADYDEEKIDQKEATRRLREVPDEATTWKKWRAQNAGDYARAMQEGKRQEDSRPQPGQLMTVKSDADYDKIPSGKNTKYVDPDGNVRTKP